MVALPLLPQPVFAKSVPGEQGFAEATVVEPVFAPTRVAPPGASRTASPPRSVRLSLTDRCDLACVYCRPHKNDGYKSDRLDLGAWKVMVDGLVRAGVRRVRLTGGEPLLSPFVVDVVRHLATLGLDDLALTTNATRLRELARPLRDAGLRRVNVSLDSLDAECFRRMTRGGDLARVLAGIEAARAAGFDEIKLNAVVVRMENDGELESLVRWSWSKGMTPRLLEVMAIGEGHKMMDKVVTVAEMRQRLAHVTEPAVALQEPERGPARYVRAKHDPGLRVGFISGTSDTYCAGCDRLRVSSDGILRPCLATNDGVAASVAARSGDRQTIVNRVAEAWSMKPDGETWRGCTEETAANVSIRAIGG
jgi:cyclic pyranopterin phosphate synthase